MADFKLFIQSNKKQYFGALLAKYSILSQSKTLTESDVHIMLVEDIPQMMKRDGQKYLRKGIWETWSSQDLQSFTMTRFLPPVLMNFKGRALVIDPDVFATEGTDIAALASRDMQGKAILACSAGENIFKSSVMLLDCEKLAHWNWDLMVDQIFAGVIDYRKLMNLELEPLGTVGILEPEWNHCDKLDETTKLIHFTRRLTQPWKTGLEIDFIYDVGNSRLKFLPPVLRNLLRSLVRPDVKTPKTYQENPDHHQQRFFFQLAKEAIQKGAITPDFIRDCIRSKYVRPDIASCIGKEI